MPPLTGGAQYGAAKTGGERQEGEAGWTSTDHRITYRVEGESVVAYVDGQRITINGGNAGISVMQNDEHTTVIGLEGLGFTLTTHKEDMPDDDGGGWSIAANDSTWRQQVTPTGQNGGIPVLRTPMGCIGQNHVL